MTKLSDTQSIILSAAAQRADGNVLPLPGSLRGGAATKVVGALLARGLIREHIIDSPRKADAAMNTIWRNLPEPDGRGVLLFITAAGAGGHRRRVRGGALRLQRGNQLRRRAGRGRAHGRRRRRRSRRPRSVGAGRGRRRPRARTSRLRRRPAAAPSRRR